MSTGKFRNFASAAEETPRASLHRLGENGLKRCTKSWKNGQISEKIVGKTDSLEIF